MIVARKEDGQPQKGDHPQNQEMNRDRDILDQSQQFLRYIRVEHNWHDEHKDIFCIVLVDRQDNARPIGLRKFHHRILRFQVGNDIQQQSCIKSNVDVIAIIGFFAFMSITIACLGLLGIATYTVERRVKEVGIRKVLGASVSSIVTALSTDFAKLVLIANLIASAGRFLLMLPDSRYSS